MGGGAVRELIKPDAEIPISNAFFWSLSPDGKSVAYSIWYPKEEKMKIAVRHIDKPDPYVILDIWPLTVFKWSPDGKRIVYKERQAGYRPDNVIFEIDVATGKSRTLLAAGRDQIEDLSYSSDNKKVAVIRGRNRSNAVLLRASSSTK